MKFNIRLFFFLLLGLLAVFSPAAAEYSEGALRLVLDEETGRFSLYALNKDSRKKPPALFSDQDPRTSFLSVMVNDRSYKMGDTSAFRIRTDGGNLRPLFIFESSFMSVTEEFTFVKSRGAAETNGVKITITLENRSDRQLNAGARFLIDTKLSEVSGIAFSTGSGIINSETLVSGTDGNSFWIDKNDTASLYGTIGTGTPQDPDSVHFANWKKLSGAAWKAHYQPGRNFNDPPYSVDDSALCYYFESRPLSRGEKRVCSFTLACDDEGGFDLPLAAQGAVESGSSGSIIDMTETGAGQDASTEHDLAALRELSARIEALMASGTATEEEIDALELSLNKLRAKYGAGTR